MAFCGARFGHAAENAPSDKEIVAEALVGEYVLIGRKPDSEVTYTGRVTIARKPQGLEYTRSIVDGGVGYGPVSIDPSTPVAGRPTVRMTFPMGDDVCTVTYLYQKTATGLTCLSGHVQFLQPKQTHVAGLEALFPLKEVRIQ